MNNQRRQMTEEAPKLTIRYASEEERLHEIEILEKRIVPTGSGETVLPL